jgi:hypothetical protein
MNSLFRKTKFPGRFTEASPQVVDSALQSLVKMVQTGRNFAEFPDKFPVLREFGPSEAYYDRLIPADALAFAQAHGEGGPMLILTEQTQRGVAASARFPAPGHFAETN